MDGHLVNISLSGAFIRTQMVLARFAPLEVELMGCIIPSFVVRVLSDGIGTEWSGRLPRILESALLAQPMTSNIEPSDTNEVG